MTKIGEFILRIKVFEENSLIKPKFETAELNISREVLITQIKSFLSILEESYKQDFKENNDLE